jgi:hypothetical protein
MVREEHPGSLWAIIVAVLAVTGTIGLLYLPLVLK